VWVLVFFFNDRTVYCPFDACGHRIETIDIVTFPPSPEGARKLELLASIPGSSEDLSTAEFLVTARPAD